MSRCIKLLGLDCGSTTTSVVVAKARLSSGALARMEISQLEVVFRSDLVFTPFDGNSIDLRRLAQYLDDWMHAAAMAPDEIFGGGALVTGLAAQTANAVKITELIESRLAGSVVASADDPVLESWLAFMGNCHGLSTAHPELAILNLDMGGGTTNLAWGRAGQVTATACLFVGARHFQFTPGTFQLTQVSAHGRALLDHLQIGRQPGDTLLARELDAILDWYLALIEAAVEGFDEPFQTPIGRLHCQVVPPSQTQTSPFCLTLSGGIGELVYAQLRGETVQNRTHFGDLGGELAARILRWPRLAKRIGTLVPEGLGRSTVFGLLKHGTDVSGSTLYLPRPERLPLAHVPIVGRISTGTSDDELRRVLDLAYRSAPAGAIQIDLASCDLPTVRTLGNRIANVLEHFPTAPEKVLVALVPINAGKALGSYMTRWGTLKLNLIVVDEVPIRDAQFVRLGKVVESTIGVSLYGMR